MRASLIIAAFNEGDLLANTIQSCIDTVGGLDHELIVADDNSTDGSVSRLIAKYPQVRVVSNSTQLGASPTKALGARHARGEVLVFLDGHTKPDYGAIQRLVEDVELSDDQAIFTPRIPILDTRHWRLDFSQTGNGYKLDLKTLSCNWVTLDQMRRTAVTGRTFYESPALIGCALAIGRGLYERLQGFDPHMRIWGVEDLDFGLKCWLMGYPILHDPEATVGHRFRSTFDTYSIPVERLIANQLRMARKNLTHATWAEWVGGGRMRYPGPLAGHPEGLWAYAWELFEADRASADQERSYLHSRRTRDEFWYAERFGLDWPRLATEKGSAVSLVGPAPKAATAFSSDLSPSPSPSPYPPPPPPPPPHYCCVTGNPDDDSTDTCNNNYSGQSTGKPVFYSDGAVLLVQSDLSIPNRGFFGQTRTYTQIPGQSGPYFGANGFNWMVFQSPYAENVSGTSLPTVAIVLGAKKVYWFEKIGGSYVPTYSFLGVSLTENATTKQLTFTQSQSGRLIVTVFNGLDASSNPGALVSRTDANGLTTSVVSRTGDQVNELQRSFTVSGVTTTESLLYTYFGSGTPTPNVLQSVQYRRKVASGSWTPAQQASYTYYESSDADGSELDLKTVQQQLPDGSGGWNTVAMRYYRYWLAGDPTGFAHALKMDFGPEACRLMFNAGIDLDSASDATIQPYADHYFEYDPDDWQATKEIAAVCQSCVGGGASTDLFAYSSNPAGPAWDYNAWQTKTVQTLPDGSQIVVYTNYVGMPMLVVNVDSTGANMWATFYRYNSDGQAIWEAQPSAVALPTDLSTLEAYADLLNYDPSTESYQYLNKSVGLINVTDYYTTTGGGGVETYVQDNKVRQGQGGSDVLVKSFTYSSNTDSDGNTVYPVATLVSYPNAADPSVTITTSYSYTYYSGTNQMSQRTTTLPAVSSGQNGSGTAYTIVEQYDTYGNLTQRTDERGIVNTFTFDVVLKQVAEQVLNYQSGVTAPGVNLTTDFAYDLLGRLIQTTGPSHTVVLSGTATSVQGVTWNVYLQSVQPDSGTWDTDQNWTGTGYATSGPTYTLIDPVTITKADKDGRPTDNITSHRTSGSGALSPTDTFDQTDWQTWSSTQYDEQHRTISSRVYFLIPSSGEGTAGTNYGQTTYGYDALERRNRVVAPGGTITRTVWTCPQQVASIWAGTNDTGATDSNPAGSGSPNNMVMVTANVWDGGNAGGDHNLTQQTQYASATDTRVTSYGYDFRDRQTSMTDAIGGYTTYAYDNLDRQPQVQRYASPTGNLIARSGTNYDDRGRVYQQITYAVDPGTGTVGNALTSNSWYDPSGNLLQQINAGDGQVFSKNTYNGVGWVTATYRGYNASGTSYSQATTVANDTIFEQTQNTYDEAGNLVSSASFQRLNDAPSTGAGSTGALSYSADPKARVSHVAAWFDGIGHNIATANYGAISSFTRPDTPPSSSATILVTSTSYNEAGQPSQVTDPMGYVTQTSYDAARRTTQTVEAYGSGSDRTTNYTYTLDDLIETLTAVNSTTGDQTTTYAYGTTLSDSGVARNDLLVAVTYPDSVSDSDVVSYTYNRQGQQATITDQRGTVRTFYYDKLGRLTDNCVATVGDDTDDAILRISTTYEVRGLVQTVTSYDNATPGSGTALNQCALTYNSFAQLVEEQQDHGGAVSGSSPSVQYGYDSGASGSNEIRPATLTYPNGRVLTYNYASGMDSTLNRVTSLSDTSATLASYAYLGTGTVIRITYPEPEVWLDLWGGTSGTFNGLDQFNRIIDQRWQNGVTTSPIDIDRYQYGYDQDSNRLYKANVVGTPIVTAGLDEYYTYDPLNRLTEMQRGVLNGTKTGITGTPSVEQDWTLDPTGNWSGFVTEANGTTNLNQTRTSNKVNEITDITESTGPTWVVPAYDAGGNTTTMPQVADPTQSFTAVYDAWNRMTSVSDSSGTVASYTYDGRNRRIIKVTASTSEIRHFYYTNQWQDIEERIGTSASMDKQYVWGIRYIDELVCRDDATPQRLYACQDANFNVTSITDASGAVQERYLFDPYGNRTIMDAVWSVISTSSFAWVAGYQGLLHDVASGLIYDRTRVVHPMLGEFLHRDMAIYADGTNLYLLNKSNPIKFLDPSGTICICTATAPRPVVPCILGRGTTTSAKGVGCAPPFGAPLWKRCACRLTALLPCWTVVTWTCIFGIFSNTNVWISTTTTNPGCP